MRAKPLQWSFLMFLLAFVLSACDNGTDRVSTDTEPAKNAIVETSGSPSPTPVPTAPADTRYADVDFQVADIGSAFYQGRLAVSVSFSAPVPVDQSLEQWLNVETLEGDTIEGSWVANEKGTTLYFPHLAPESRYRINVRAGLPSGLGKSLGADVTSELETERLAPMLGFVGQGNLLAHKLTKGLPVISRNVSSVDVDFYRIPPNQLVGFLDDNRKAGQQEFWQVREYIDQFELAYTARFDLNVADNMQATTYLPVKNIQPLQQKGVYLAVMRESGNYEYSYPATWFAVTDLGVQMRLYRDQIEVYISELSSAKPKAGVTLQLLAQKGDVIAEQQSGSDGRASFTGINGVSPQLLLATHQGDTTLVRLYGPALDLSEFPVTGLPAQAQTLFLYAARDLYRPGEQVTVSGLLRGSDGEMVPGIPLQFKLHQPDGRVVSSRAIAAQALNYYEVTFPIAADQPTGRWEVSVELPDKTTTTYPFHVEEFLPERMKLALSGTDRLTPKQPLHVEAQGAYLYGAPAAGNRLESQLISAMNPHPFERFVDYHFGDIQVTEFNRRMELDDVKLDADGRAQIRVKPFWGTTRTPLRLKLFQSLQDMGGRPVSRSFSSAVLPAESMVGIRPLFNEDTTDYNGSAQFELIYTDGEQKLARDRLEVTLVREHRRYHWVYSEYDGWRNEYTERQYPVFTQQLVINADENTALEVPVEWGYYRLEVKDLRSGLISSYRFQAGWSEQEQALSGRPDRIGMSLDKAAYTAGERVEVRLQPPAAGKGYLVVEGDQPLYWRAIEIPDEGATVEFPLDASWARHDLYVSVMLVQPGAERDSRLPRRMLGIQPLKLLREERQLQLELTVPEKALPETTVTLPVRVTPADGQALPQKVGLTLAAVDLGVLNITSFETPDPFTGFFGQRRYGVEARDNYGALIDADDGELANFRFGGDADLKRGGEEPESDVQIVSLFSGVVDVDAEGVAQVPLAFPDFNGRVKLMAIAFSEHSYGSTDTELQVAAPVVTELVKPRFLAVGDRSELALQLHNLSGSAQNLNLTLRVGAGLELLQSADKQSATQTLTLADGARIVLRYPVRATEALGRSEIDLEVSGLTGLEADADAAFRRQWSLITRPAWSATERRWQTVLAPGEQFALASPELAGLMASGARLSLNVAGKPPLQLAPHIQALKSYPYGCLEQTTSGVFSQLYLTRDALNQMGIRAETDEERQDALRLAIQRVLGMQKSSGGFGLWNSHSPEEYWLTVYVTDFLLRAREQGYRVPEENLNQALKRLQGYLRNPRRIYSEYADNNNRTRFAVAAYAGQVLSRIGQARLADLRSLYDRRGKHWTALGFYQLGLGLQTSGDRPRAEKAQQEALQALTGNRLVTTAYGSPIRDTALALYWALETEQTSAQWEPLLFKLKDRLENRRWLSTQERNALLLAGLALAETPVDNVSLSLKQGTAEQALPLVPAGRVVQHFSGTQAFEAVTLNNLGGNRAYLSAQLAGYSQQSPAAQDAGISVTRSYYDLDGNALVNPELNTGDLLLVELDVSVEKPLHHLLLVDLLPAGLELENQNLATAFALSDLRIGDASVVELMQDVDIRHQEFRDDRYVAALNTGWQKRARLFYLARAVSPGVFTLPPTFAEDMYRPEIRHQGEAAGQIEIRAGE